MDDHIKGLRQNSIAIHINIASNLHMISEMDTVEASPPAVGSWVSDSLSSLFAGAAGSSHSYQESDDNFLHSAAEYPLLVLSLMLMIR